MLLARKERSSRASDCESIWTSLGAPILHFFALTFPDCPRLSTTERSCAGPQSSAD